MLVLATTLLLFHVLDFACFLVLHRNISLLTSLRKHTTGCPCSRLLITMIREATETLVEHSVGGKAMRWREVGELKTSEAGTLSAMKFRLIKADKSLEVGTVFLQKKSLEKNKKHDRCGHAVRFCPPHTNKNWRKAVAWRRLVSDDGLDVRSCWRSAARNTSVWQEGCKLFCYTLTQNGEDKTQETQPRCKE